MEDAALLNKAFNNACKILGINDSTKSAMLALDNNESSHYTSRLQSKCDIQIFLIEIYKSLNLITNNDHQLIQKWLHTYNNGLSRIPADLLINVAGLTRVHAYLSKIGSV